MVVVAASDQTGLFVAALVITLFRCVRGGKILRRRRRARKLRVHQQQQQSATFESLAARESSGAHLRKTQRIFRKEMPGASAFR